MKYLYNGTIYEANDCSSKTMQNYANLSKTT